MDTFAFSHIIQYCGDRTQARLSLTCAAMYDLCRGLWFDRSMIWNKEEGCKECRFNRKLHRYDDLPTVIYVDEGQSWCMAKRYYPDGSLSAPVCEAGSQEWYKNGQLHRDNGPAVIEADGKQIWFQNGKPYDSNGPAITDPDGIQRKWIKGP